MRFPARKPRRAAAEPTVAMINVVFLLLIFFLMSAAITAPPPVDVTLPGSEGAEAERGGTSALFVSAEGVAAFGQLRGADAISAAAQDSETVDIRADARSPAARLAEILAELARQGVQSARLITAAE